MDFLIELLLEIYMELMLLIVPEKNISKRQKLFAKIIAICVIAAIAAMVIWGLVLIIDHGNLWGVVPITIAVALSLAQIIAGLILYKRNH